MQWMIIINILLIVFLYRKYIYYPKNTSEIKINVEKLDSALLGYMDNNNKNTLDLLLAEILEISRKKYVNLECDRVDIDEYEYVFSKKNPEIEYEKMKPYELIAYRTLFRDQYVKKITMHELGDRIKVYEEEATGIRAKNIALKNAIKSELTQLGIVDEKAEKLLKIIEIMYVVFFIMEIVNYKSFNMTQIAILCIENLLMLFMFEKVECFSEYGKRVKCKVKEYAKKLKSNGLDKERNIEYQILKEKEYADSVAFVVNSKVREEFIYDELIYNEKNRHIKYSDEEDNDNDLSKYI